MPTSNLAIRSKDETTSEPPAFFVEGPRDNPQYRFHSVSSGSGYETVPVEFESRIAKGEPSTVQEFSQWELSEHYRALGTVLSELTALEEEDEWKIDASVYNIASYFATELRSGWIPAPSIFVHGPTSVVFNWSGGMYNFYLTIGANNVSALFSSPERILRRIEYSGNEWPNPVALLPFIQSAGSASRVISTTSATSDLPEFFG